MNWKEFEEKCTNCNKCSLCNSRTNIVLGRGNRLADIMLIGEAPGKEEDLSGEPFVGRSGKLLDSILDEAGLSREEIYIANILKCRPPDNRDPKPTETKACIDFLYNQIELVNPKILVCLGKIPATTLIKKDFKVTVEHGNWFDFNGIPITGVYHPSAVLRFPKYKNDWIADFTAIKNK